MDAVRCHAELHLPVWQADLWLLPLHHVDDVDSVEEYVLQATVEVGLVRKVRHVWLDHSPHVELGGQHVKLLLATACRRAARFVIKWNDVVYVATCTRPLLVRSYKMGKRA